jgi:hypothetical protein
MRSALISCFAALAVATTAAAQSQTINGVGQAPITRDSESVRASAEQGAREDLIRALARQTIGAERLRELSPDMVTRLANQISNDMIVNRSAERIGQSYKITLSARVDTAWFMKQLDDEGVQNSADAAQADMLPIFVMIDENTGPARDLGKPAAIVTEYDHSVGSDYRDKSIAAYSDKDRTASSHSAAAADTYSSATSEHSRGAAGYSDGYGAAGYSGSSGSASATRGGAASAERDAAAYSHNEAAISKTDVAASDHNDTHFFQQVVYQTSSTTGPAKAARTGVGAALMRYGVTMATSDLELATFFHGAPPTYSNLKASTGFQPFVTYLSRKNVAPFFMGGTLTERDNGRDPATGRAACTGSFEATAFATGDSRQIAASAPHATATGESFEDCEANLSQNLALQAAAEMGPQIQGYWRRQTRRQASAVAVASSSSDYTLTVRAATLTMDMQADLMDALGSISGVEKQAFLGQNGNQISFQVHYSGSVPLQMALYQKLRSHPAFAQMQPTVQGQSVTLCLSACAAQ